MNKKINLLYFFGIVYFITYATSFNSIITFGIFPWQFFLELGIISLLLFISLKNSKIREYSEITNGFKIMITLLITGTIAFHLLSGILGGLLGPSFVKVSDNPQIRPMEIPNNFLVAANYLGLAIILAVALILGYNKDKSFRKNENLLNKYLIIAIMVISFLFLNYFILIIINIMSLLYGLSTGG
ncbi:MAG: hypothetical protein AABX00_06670 [Nanoarchaeota archaeon]